MENLRVDKARLQINALGSGKNDKNFDFDLKFGPVRAATSWRDSNDWLLAYFSLESSW